MAIGREALKLDSFGILPRMYESVDEYVERGLRTLNYSDVEDMLDVAQDTLRRKGVCKSLWALGNQDYIGKAEERFEERFGCDMSWVKFYCGNLGEEPMFGGYYVAAYTVTVSDVPKENSDDVYHIPPFVVVNTIEEPRMLYRDLLHEMAHVVRDKSVRSSISMYDQKSYEERMGDHSSGRLLKSLEKPLEVNIMFLQGVAAMRRACGKMADYALIRINCDEMKDWFIDGMFGTKDPKEIICKVAEGHGPSRLRYSIMKEKLNF